MPVHHLLEEILNEYIVAAGLQSGQPLFQSLNSLGTAVTGRALNRYNAWAAIRKRAKAAGFLTPVGCHTWRATGITIYLENDGRLEHAQQMAGHESPRTTKLYDRTKDEITLSEVERIRLCSYFDERRLLDSGAGLSSRRYLHIYGYGPLSRNSLHDLQHYRSRTVGDIIS
jgi:hypothetical protein